jgi:hypothetical protein
MCLTGKESQRRSCENLIRSDDRVDAVASEHEALVILAELMTCEKDWIVEAARRMLWPSARWSQGRRAAMECAVSNANLSSNQSA